MLKHRSTEKEIMDDLSFSGSEMDHTLHELRIINRWLGGNAVTTSGLKKLLQDKNVKPPVANLSIADLGCGGGDMLLLMRQWLRKNHIQPSLVGIDANPYIIQYAQEQTKAFSDITYQSLNVFDPAFALQKFDLITCTLFCHHFTDSDLIVLLKQLRKQTNIGIVINDLHRHWVACSSINLLTRLFSKSEMVKNDAKLSVQRGFLHRELVWLLTQAGYKKFSIKWKWAFRFEVVAWI